MDGLIKPEELDFEPKLGTPPSPAANDQPKAAQTEDASRPEFKLPPGPGAVLRAERESRGYSIDEVAHALKLAPRQVEAIEADDFDALRGLTFARGFVKNYAKLFQLDPEPLVARIRSRNPSPVVTLEPQSGARAAVPSASGSQGPVAAGGLAVLALVVVAVVGNYSQWIGGDAGGKGDAASSAQHPATTAPATPPVTAVAEPASPPAQATSPDTPPVTDTSGASLFPPGWVANSSAAAAVPLPVATPNDKPAVGAAPVAAQPVVAPVVTPTATPATKPAVASAPVAVSVAAPPTPTQSVTNAAPVIAPASATKITLPTKPAVPVAVPSTPATPATPANTVRSGDLAMTASVVRYRTERKLTLNFDQDAWVQVKDGDGRVVFSQLTTAGGARVVEGKPPLSLVVGNAHHVRLKVDDQPYNLKQHIGVTVARFSLN